MAINPVRADSRMPNGPISFRNESIRFGFAELGDQSQHTMYPVRYPWDLTHISTMQLLLLISRTLPPNW
jgi:hypothetical protein